MKKLLLLSFVLLSVTSVEAQTVNHLHDPSSVCIDGNTQNLGAVTFTTSDFSNGCEITDVDVTIWWAKTDGACPNPTGGGCSYHNETSFALNAPSGTENLAIAGSWGGANNCASSPNSVTTTFNTGSPAIPAPNFPVSGTYSPNGGSLANYNGESALGTWSLAAGDLTSSDPLLVGAYRLVVTTATDNTNPDMVVPSTITVSNDPGQCGATVNYSVSSTDVCGATHSLTSPAGTASGQFFPVGTTTVTWEATDTYNNQQTSSFNIVVNDTEAPSISCPSNITTTVAAGTCAQNVTYSLPTHSDNCGVSNLSLISGAAPGGSFPEGTTSVTYIATDPVGNAESCSFTVTVNDNIPPTISCPADFSVNASAGQCSATVNYATVTANDNCPGVTVIRTVGPATASTVGVGTTTITHVATDGSSNTASCSFVVTVVDNQAPTISCPANISVGNATGSCGALVTWTAPTGTDNCPGSVTVQSAGPSSGSPFAAETTTTISYEVGDGAGLSASCSFTVTVEDTELPVATCPADIITSVDAGQCSAVVSFADATYSDNCLGGTISQTGGLTSNSQFGVNSSPNTVTYTATDAAGNAGTCSFTITVNDNEDPTIICPADIIVANDPGQCDAVVSWTVAVGADNCPGQSTVLTAGLAPGSTFSVLSTTTISYEVTDASLNTADCSFTVTVEDNDFPIVTCPADQNVTFPVCEYTVPDYVGIGLATSSDNCTPLTVVQTPSASTIITQETVVQVSATDPSGNETLCEFTISPLDNSVPTFDNCPTSSEQVSVNASCQFFMPDYSTLSVSDDCNPTLTFTQSPAAGIPATTTTSVTVTVSDGTNSADCTFDVEPLDDTNPTIVCQGDQTVSPNASCEYDLIDFTGLGTATDNCDNSVDITQFPAIGTTISSNTTVTLTATDDNSNIATCSFLVVLEDDTPPVVNCPVDQDEDYNALCQFTIVDYTSLGLATDNCDNSPTITQSPAAGTSIGSTIAVVLTAADPSGNTSTCSFDVIPDDNTAPNISCPATQLLDVDVSCNAALANYTGLATTSDNCDGAPTVTQSPAATTAVAGAGTSVTVTLTSTDASSNSNTCNFTVTTQDVTPPSITCAADLNVNFDASCQFTVGNYVGTPTVMDNCSGSVVTQSPALGTVISGQTTVTLTATDVSGLQGTCTFEIIPDDNEVPSITCPIDIPVDFDANCQVTLADYTVLGTVSDNCDLSVDVTQSPAFGTVVSASTVITLTATDDASNTNTCTFSVIPSDNTVPTVTCPVDQNEDFSASCEFDLIDYTGLITEDDNCDNSLTVVQSPSISTTINGSQVVTITVTDDNANSASCTFNVIPDDNTDPTITCPGDDNVSFNAQCAHNLVDYTGDATTGDNCDTDVVVSQIPASGTSIGTATTVTLSATDDAGNTADCTFDVIPVDDEDPTIVCPGNQAVSFDGSCEYELLDYTSLATSTDNCTNVPAITQDIASGTTITSTTTIMLTASDGASNTATCTFDVIPSDVTQPAVSCPGDQTESFDTDCQFALIDYTGFASTTDNCDATPALTQSPAVGTAITGQTVITITSQDASGNTNTCTFDVVPVDDTHPTITCPPAQTVSSNASCQFAIIDYTSVATADDNCDQVVTVTQSPGSGTIITVPTTVTLTATDDDANSADCSFLVTPADNDNPNITCPGDQFEDFDADCEFEVIDYTGLASASDNCSGAPTVTQDVSVGTIVTGTTTITLTATDDDLNTATCAFDVIPDDNTAPSVTCPINQEESFGAQCQFILPSYLSSVSSSDNCDNNPSLAQSPVAGSVIGGNTIVTVTSIDANGNIGTCTFTVSVSDVTGPIVGCPSDVSEVFDAGCSFELPDYTNQPSVSDNCDAAPFMVTQSPAAGTSVTGTTLITLSVTDGASNTGTCTFSVIPVDNEDPTISCPVDQTVSVDGSCELNLLDYTGSVSANDNCDNSLDIVQSPAAVSTISFNTIVTITATDDAGNSASCTFNVNPVDDTAPVLTCPSNINVSADEDCSYTVPDVTFGATLSDNCDNTPFITQFPPIGSVIGGTATVTLTVTDVSGNSSSCDFDIMVDDAEPPTVGCPANQVEVLSASCDFTVPSYSSLVSTDDNCDSSVDLVQSPAVGSTISSNTTVTFSATDDHGNIGTCSFTLVLEDQTDPTISCPGDQTVALGANCQFIVANYMGLTSSSDNCDPSLAVTQSPLAGSLIGGSTVLTVSAEDNDGNIGTCSFNVIPDDVDPPTIFDCPSDITVDNDEAICGAVVTYATITSLDNCAGVVVPTLNQGQLSGTVFDVGTTEVVWVADDGNGNTTNCEFEVIVNDTEDPIILCPSDITVNVDPNTCGAMVTYTLPNVTDNCTTPIIPTLDAGLSSGSTFPEGSLTVTYGAEDQYGNTSSCSFTVTVNDNEAPTITCPPSLTVDNDSGLCSAVVTYGAPVVGDNCPSPIGPTLVSGGASGDIFPVGVSPITYSVVDASGNTNDCTFSVTVEDNEDPVLTCPADTSINCDAVVVYDDPTVSDNCVFGIVPVQTSPTIGDPLVFGPNVITFSGDDGNGNTGTCSFTVTIIDTVAPVITCPADLTEAFDANCELAAPDYTGLGIATDNCDGAPVFTQAPTPGSTINGSAVITLIATDFANNSSECTFNVIDNTPPTVSCPADVVVGSDNNCEFALIDYTLSSVSADNCGGVVLSQDPAIGTVISSLTTVTITSQDDFGNTTDCQFTVDLIDNIDPSITCIGIQTVLFDANCEHELGDYTSNIISTDNCDPSVAITQDPVATTVVAGVTTVTMTATDASGNSVSCTFDISPIDVLPPSIDCPVIQLVDFDADCEFLLADYSGLGVTDDNCSAVTVTQIPAAGATLNASTVITLTATDVDLNAASCTFLVEPEDNEAPTIDCPADFEVDFDVNCEYTLVDYTGMGTPDDNCSTVFTLGQSPVLGTIVSGSIVVTLTVEDESGNTADCSFNITPEDSLAPSLTCIDDQTVFFDVDCEFELGDYTATPTSSDNCSGSVTVTQSPAVGTFITGATEVVLTGDDGNGNTASCTLMVLPEDDTDPTIVCPTSLDVQFGSQGCSYLMSDLTSLVTADDNCASVVSITQDPAIGTLVTDTLFVLFTADDGNGNTATCSFQVNPSDETEPTISCPSDVAVDFNEDCEFELPDYKPLVVTNDNCGFTLTSQSPTEGTLITVDTEILMTVDDGNGNSTTCTFMVTPADNTPPAIVCPSNLFEDLDESCQYEMLDYTGLATAEDNCSPVVTMDQFPPSGTIILSSTVITLTVTDNVGNQEECSFVILPEDNTLPAIAECAEDQFAILDENCELAMPDFTGLILAVDNCDIDLDYQQLPLAGSGIAGVGTYAITVGAGDDANNFALCEFDLIVSDESNPTIDCPTDQIIELNANCLFEVPDYTALATASDACGTVTLTQSPLTGSTITGQLNATIIAEDENGNTSTCTFFVDVLEMSASALGTDVTCQGGSDGTATVSVVGGSAPYTEDWGGFNPLALSAGTYAVTVSDANGCSTTASVTIEDGLLFEIEIDPTGDIEICDGGSVTLDAGSGYAVYNWSTGASVQTITASSEASYWVTVTSAEGCISNTDTAYVMYYDDPLPTVISVGDGIISCSNDTASTYQWYLNGVLIVGATESYYCPLESGNYYVVITDSHGCTVSSLIEGYTYDENSPCATGIEEYGLTLDVFPNPSDGLFTVSYALDQQTDMLFAVYNLVGQRVTEDELISAHTGTTVIDLSGITDGIYTLRIAIGTKTVLHQRLVLVK